MTVEQLQQSDLLPLRMSDSVSYALGTMDEFKLHELPVVDGDIFRGLVREDRLNRVEDENLSLKDAGILPEAVFVDQSRSIQDGFRSMYEGKLSMLPVLDENGMYSGYVPMENAFREACEILGADTPGGVIILEMAVEDFHLSEIAQILESNDLRAISITTKTIDQSTRLEVIIKTDSKDLGRALQSFSRYEYHVKMAEFEDLHDVQLNDRYEMLMRFLDV